jgi:hypothetical protein
MGRIRKIKRLDTGGGAENAKMHSIESDLLALKMTCFLVYQLSSLAKDQY